MQLPGMLEEHRTVYPLVEKDPHSTKVMMAGILGQIYLPTKDFPKEPGVLAALLFRQ